MCEIVYVESYSRILVLHLVNGETEEFYGKLKEVFSDQLKKADFIHIHASHAVNFSHIVSFTSTKLTVTTGVTLPISRSKKDEVEETYFAITERQKVV